MYLKTGGKKCQKNTAFSLWWEKMERKCQLKLLRTFIKLRRQTDGQIYQIAKQTAQARSRIFQSAQILVKTRGRIYQTAQFM
jgi:hypothetical protein